jgi:Cu/Ag efflux protein CusF
MRPSVRVYLLSALLSIPLSGCGSSDKHYTLTGRVVSKVSATREIVVDHDEIQGFMAAMTMRYTVAEEIDLSGIEPGDRIRADIDVKPDGQYSLDRISVTDSSHREKAPIKILFSFPVVAFLVCSGVLFGLLRNMLKAKVDSHGTKEGTQPCPHWAAIRAEIERETGDGF